MHVGIPHPCSVTSLDGFFTLTNLMCFLPVESDKLDLEAARLIQAEVLQHSGCSPSISKAWRLPYTKGLIALGSPDSLRETMGLEMQDVPGDEEGYTLSIQPEQVIICARTARGRLWGAQTFRQLLRQYGRTLPAMRIDDAPAMRYRGVMLDLARRKVPKVDTLKRLVDTLSLLKLNMLQLQIEHTFQWQRHPLIGAGCGSLSCEDILELDAHCHNRGVELVPMLQSFGHMRNILALDEYRHLAENEHLQWSLNPTDPATLQLMDELYEEYLPCFSSSLVNIGSDEAVDLGRDGGKSNAEIARVGIGRVYLNRILELHQLLTEKYGKQVMMWGDVVLNHPELIPDLPRELIMLNWHYSAADEFPQVKLFAENSIPQIVCPSTFSCHVLFPRVNVAWVNMENLVRDGKAAGALGVLNTDWGDAGHFNLLGGSYYSFAHGAEASWAQQPMPRAEFERLLAPIVFGPDCEDVVTAIHALGCGDFNPSIPDTGAMTAMMVFKSPFETAKDHAGRVESFDWLRSAPLITEARRDERAALIFDDAIPHSLEPSAVADLAWEARALAYGKRKTAFMFDIAELAEGRGNDESLLATCEDLLMDHAELVETFRERWNAGNRHSQIEIALAQFAHGEQGLHIVNDWLKTHRAEFSLNQRVPPPIVPNYVYPWSEDISSLWQNSE